MRGGMESGLMVVEVAPRGNDQKLSHGFVSVTRITERAHASALPGAVPGS